MFWRRPGGRAYSPFPLDAVHTYHYIPDVAAGLATLGAADAGAYGGPWMLPCTPAGTLRDLVTRMTAFMEGRPIKVAQIPSWVIKAAGLAVPLMRELGEMAYQWEEPFIVDDSRFRARFASTPVEVDTAAAQTVGWAVQHYRQGPSAA
jgi:hypothetical protein